MKFFDSVALKDKIVLRNVLMALAVKGGSLIISFLSTPRLIVYFNDNAVLGVWFTLLSVLMWFLNFDLGIGNGIRNCLVKAFCHNDREEAKSIISSGIASIGCVTLVISTIGIVLFNCFNLNEIFNISPEIISSKTLHISIAVVFFAVMLRFFLTIVSSVFYALQMSAMNNFLALLVSVLQYIFIIAFSFDNSETSLIALSLAYFFISNFPLLIAAVILFCTKIKECRPNIKYISKKYINQVLRIGGIFFMCQIMYMGIVNTNEFLITKFFDPSYTTEYTIYYKTTSLLAMLISLAMTPIWSVVTKAIEENDWVWLSNMYKKIKLFGIGAIVVEFLSIPFLQIFINIWLGDSAIDVDYIIALSFSAFGSVFIYSTMLSTMVCGMTRMKLQAVCYTVGVIIKIVFVVLVSRYTSNWSIVVWSNAVILLPYCIFQQIDLNIYIKDKVNMQKLIN